MRIAAVLPLYPPSARVGAYLATHEFLKALLVRGHDVTAFAYYNNEPEFDHDGIHVETGVRGRTHAFAHAAGADVVVSHAGDGGFGLEVAHELGASAVRMVHGAGYATVGDDADLAVFNSASLRELAGHGDNPRAIVAHPPVDRAAFTTTRGDRITIVNTCVEKGIDTAWRVAELLPDHLFLGVHGGYGEQVVARARNFETIPTTSQMRDDVYARTRILLMPSAFETWGMVAVEAMCSGIPVIAHPTAGLLESLGDAGMFVDRDDIDGWANAVLALDDPDTYADASRMAADRAAELTGPEALTTFCEAVEALPARREVAA